VLGRPEHDIAVEAHDGLELERVDWVERRAIGLDHTLQNTARIAELYEDDAAERPLSVDEAGDTDARTGVSRRDIPGAMGAMNSRLAHDFLCPAARNTPRQTPRRPPGSCPRRPSTCVLCGAELDVSRLQASASLQLSPEKPAETPRDTSVVEAIRRELEGDISKTLRRRVRTVNVQSRNSTST
jgi:hypothetical protein